MPNTSSCLLAATSALIFFGSACTGSQTVPNSPALGSPDEAAQKTESTDPEAGELDLDYCEELFQTLNTLNTSDASVDTIGLAEKSGKENAEHCRVVFRNAAKSPGSALIADIFADLMLVRTFELSLDRRALQNKHDGVCPDTKDALERIKTLQNRASQALGALKLQEHEQGVLRQVVQRMGDKHNSLEPFYLRGCKTGSFNPALFVSIDDLQIKQAMTPDECKDVVVALAAFDLEQAPQAQFTKLIETLKAAAMPCRTAMVHSGPVKDLAQLEALSQIELLETGPLMLEIGVALSNNQLPDACDKMKKYLTLIEKRQETLSLIIQATQTPKRVQEKARNDLAATVDMHKSFSQDFAGLCSL